MIPCINAMYKNNIAGIIHLVYNFIIPYEMIVCSYVG